MEETRWAADEGGEETEARMVGGKLTRRSFRRAQPTPYDRPQPKTRWFSRFLVQPAARILPSLFSSSSSASEGNLRHLPSSGASPPPPPGSEQKDSDRASILDFDNRFFQSQEAGASAETCRTKVISKCHDFMVSELKNSYDGSELAEIEQRLKLQTFSRDESNRLIELLRLRTTDLSHDDGGLRRFTVEATEGLNQKDLMSSEKEKHAVQCDPRTSWKISDPLQLYPHDDVGSSPVDIAKAYMKSFASAPGHDGHNGRLVVEKRSSSNDEYASKSSFPSDAKSPICWPGAIVQNNRRHFTPQTRIGRVGQHNMLRTPYPGAFFSKSAFKSQGSCERPCERSSNLSSVGWKQNSSSVFVGSVAMKRRNSVLDDEPASIGSTQRARLKNMATIASEEPDSFKVGSSFSFQKGSSDILEGFSPLVQGNRGHDSLEDGVLRPQPAYSDRKMPSFVVDSSTVHPQSSEAARRILQHLDRTLPSSKEKSQELKMVTAGMNTPPKAVPPMVDHGMKVYDPSVLNKYMTGCSFGKDIGAQESVDAQKQVINARFLGQDQLPSLPTETGKQGILELEKNADFHIPKSVPHLSLQAAISASSSSTKPGEKPKPTGDFTFHVPVAPNVFTEQPPTPTMVSSVAPATRISGTNRGTTPSFRFGSSNANNHAVLSFKDVASSNFADKPTPKFSFGSDKSRSLSFRVPGKYAMCY